MKPMMQSISRPRRKMRSDEVMQSPRSGETRGGCGRRGGEIGERPARLGVNRQGVVLAGGEPREAGNGDHRSVVGAKLDAWIVDARATPCGLARHALAQRAVRAH